MASTPEGKVKEACKKYLKSIGAWYFMPVSNGMGQVGIPDIICCYKGQFLAVEIEEAAGGQQFGINLDMAGEALFCWINRQIQPIGRRQHRISQLACGRCRRGLGHSDSRHHRRAGKQGSGKTVVSHEISMAGQCPLRSAQYNYPSAQ